MDKITRATQSPDIINKLTDANIENINLAKEAEELKENGEFKLKYETDPMLKKISQSMFKDFGPKLLDAVLNDYSEKYNFPPAEIMAAFLLFKEELKNKDVNVN